MESEAVDRTPAARCEELVHPSGTAGRLRNRRRAEHSLPGEGLHVLLPQNRGNRRADVGLVDLVRFVEAKKRENGKRLRRDVTV